MVWWCVLAQFIDQPQDGYPITPGMFKFDCSHTLFGHYQGEGLVKPPELRWAEMDGNKGKKGKVRGKNGEGEMR